MELNMSDDSELAASLVADVAEALLDAYGPPTATIVDELNLPVVGGSTPERQLSGKPEGGEVPGGRENPEQEQEADEWGGGKKKRRTFGDDTAQKKRRRGAHDVATVQHVVERNALLTVAAECALEVVAAQVSSAQPGAKGHIAANCVLSEAEATPENVAVVLASLFSGVSPGGVVLCYKCQARIRSGVFPVEYRLPTKGAPGASALRRLPEDDQELVWALVLHALGPEHLEVMSVVKTRKQKKGAESTGAAAAGAGVSPSASALHELGGCLGNTLLEQVARGSASGAKVDDLFRRSLLTPLASPAWLRPQV